mgnify:CR=1 FL=1
MVAPTKLIARNNSTNEEFNLPDNEGNELISQRGEFCSMDPRKPNRKKISLSSPMYMY